MFQVDGYTVPDPPWVVCRRGEQRIFDLQNPAGGEFEMRVLDGRQAVIAKRTFPTVQLAIEWGFAQRRSLQNDGWKHPYDADIDDAFEDGVRNWNLLELRARGSQFPLWEFAMKIPQAERACEQYAGAPYLGLLADDELFARYRLLFMSTMTVSPDGHVDPAGWGESHDKWLHSATEVLLRKLSLEDERGKPNWSFLSSERFRRAAARWKPQWGNRILVKYGSASFLRPALEQGIFRISPASYYNDPSLNAARRDAELERRLVDTATVLTSTFRRPAEKLSEEKKDLYSRTVQSATDYYIFCIAGGWELRLFEDFHADACLVVTDPLRFAEALGQAAQAELPGWHFACDYVRYIDPVQDLEHMDAHGAEQFAPFFCKDFRYSYQREVRAAWLPPDPAKPEQGLDHIFLRLGSLETYCELVEI